MGKVTKIPAKVKKYTAVPLETKGKRRVAGYARVSTDKEEQTTSYEAQVDYYESYIKSREDWEFVGIYTDEGISATNTKKREGFNRMIKDAIDGKIDLIVTKSVSRFARNTVDSLSTVRKLKDKGIEIYFEKENIWTLDSKGELLITIMSSLAQEESRSISENVTWGHRKRFADGKVTFAYSNFLGLDYDKETGKLVINEEEAKVVRLIFKLFLDGHNSNTIANELMRRGIKTPSGKDKWRYTGVRRILENEKYKGDALLQKEFTVDFLQKKMKKNEGEVPQYYVEGNHEAIISPELFDLVQIELKNRIKNKRGGTSLFSGKIKCCDCGHWYGARTHHSTDKYRKRVYQCSWKYKGMNCKTPLLYPREIEEAFVKAFNKLIGGKKEIIKNMEHIKDELCRVDELKERHDNLEKELRELSESIDRLIYEKNIDKRYAELTIQFEEKKKERDELAEEITNREEREIQIKAFIKEIKSRKELITEFERDLWCSTVDYLTVDREKNITVYFRGGLKI